jgi:hypothetical protein
MSVVPEVPAVDPSYLADVTGSSALISIGDHLTKNGLLESLPEYVQDKYNAATAAQDQAVHQYLCNLDREAKAGQQNACGAGKAFGKYAQAVSDHHHQQVSKFNVVPKVPLVHGKRRGSVSIAQPASRYGKNLTGVDGRFQRQRAADRDRVKPYSYQKIDPGKADPKDDELFAQAVEGRQGSTVGQRAVYYAPDGRVLRGTAAIRRVTNAEQLSANTAIINQSTGSGAGARPVAAPTQKAANHPNKKHAGQTTDAGAGVAGLGALAALAVGIAALMPLHFVTSAISFINSIVNFFTTTRNAAETYLGIADGVMGIFGLRGATGGLKSLISSTLDNAFGKENLDYAKAQFAGTLNTVTTTGKVMEKIETARRGTNNRVDDLALGLGTVNNALKDAGVIPSDSPYMAQSQAIDGFVKDRTSGEDGERLKENITTLTSELQTQEQIQKELAEQREREVKKRKATDKQIEDVKRLVDKSKTNFENIESSDL